jgi:hypothetical protein
MVKNLFELGKNSSKTFFQIILIMSIITLVFLNDYNDLLNKNQQDFNTFYKRILDSKGEFVKYII